MTKEELLFLSLLKDHIYGTLNTTIQEDTDWDQVFEYAKDQSLNGVIYVQLRELSKKSQFITQEILDKFHFGFLSDVYSFANHRLFINQVIEKFQKYDVPYLLFKGWIVKEYWNVPELRTMGDIDILIHTTDREKTDSIMKSLGYERLIDNHAVWTYYAKDIVFELHDHMFYEHLTNEINYKSYFDQAWDYDEAKIDMNFHLLYLITHLAKHTINKGMGFRSYLDLIFICNKEKKLDWKWITKQLDQLKLLRFTETCFAFCKLWFEFEPPIEVKALDPEFSSFVTEKIFHDGTFGLENEQNEAAHSAKEITHSQSSYLNGALRLTMYRLFPPYRDMQLIPWYSFVDGRPWLMPVAWVYRWGYCLKHKKDYGKELLMEPFDKRKIIKDRQKLISDWGL